MLISHKKKKNQEPFKILSEFLNDMHKFNYDLIATEGQKSTVLFESIVTEVFEDGKVEDTKLQNFFDIISIQNSIILMEMEHILKIIYFDNNVYVIECYEVGENNLFDYTITEVENIYACLKAVTEFNFHNIALLHDLYEKITKYVDYEY